MIRSGRARASVLVLALAATGAAALRIVVPFPATAKCGRGRGSINPLGGALSKEQYLGGIASGELDYLFWEPDSIALRLYDEAAVIRYPSHLEIVVQGRHVPRQRYWHTDFYERRDGQWQVVWSQATEIR